MDSILVSEPIRSLNSIVHVPSPVVLVHVTQRRVDSSLCRHRVTPRGEELRYARCVETRLRQTESCSQTSSAGTDDNGIVLVVLPTIRFKPYPIRRCTYDDRVFMGSKW